MRVEKDKIKFINITCIVAIMFAVVNVYFDYNMRLTSQQMYDHPYTVSNAARAVNSRLLDMKQFIKIVLTHDFTSGSRVTNLLKKRYAFYNDDIATIYDRYHGPVEDVDALQIAFKDTIDEQRRAIEFAANHTNDEIETYIESRLYPHYNEVSTRLHTIISVVDGEIYSLSMESRRTSILSITVTLFMTIVLVFLTLYSNKVQRMNMEALEKRERDLQDALASAQRANRAKKDFFSRMSHEIRTPMNAIIGMTAIAGDHLGDHERIKDCLAKISHSSCHLLSLINDVLDMSRIEEGKMRVNHEPFQMQELLQSVIGLIYPQTNEQRKNFECAVSDDVYETYIGDALRVRQILLNLLSNAVKFTPKGGSIRLEVCQTIRKNGRAYLRFVVSDTGIGMSEEFLQRIFHPFEQADSSSTTKYGGTGLGMAITQNLVALLGGEISVKSELGCGSVFTVELPMDTQRQADAPQGPEPSSLKVLVVDDDEVVCVQASLLLERMGIKSKWLQSGSEAISCLIEAHEAGQDYDVCLVDWRMPDMDGLEVTKRVRQKFGPDVLIIIISAYDLSQIETDARAAGANAFIAKPLFASSLYNVLQSVQRNGADVQTGGEPQNDGAAGICRGKRILLVEDNEMNQEIAVELLRVTGAEIDCVENGKEAVDRFLAVKEGYYDLILMDVQMPIMNGYEATRRLRASGRSDAKSVPIFAMTANAFKEDVKDAYDSGMNGHLAKPVEVKALYTMLKSLFRS